METAIKKHLEVLQNSPVIDANLYTRLSDLCHAIKTLTTGVLDDIELLGKTRSTITVEHAKNNIFSIDAIITVIDENVLHKDFTTVCNLLYEYKALEKEKNQDNKPQNK